MGDRDIPDAADWTRQRLKQHNRRIRLVCSDQPGEGQVKGPIALQCEACEY